MKRTIIAFLLAFTAYANAGDFVDGFKSEFKEAEYGLHLVSMHVPNGPTNNGNLGVYVITKHNFVYSHYYNSVWTHTNVVGWKTPEWQRMSATFGSVTGYKVLNGRDWIFGIIPEVRLHTFKDVGGVKEINVRLEVIPNLDKSDVLTHGLYAVGLWHLAAGFKF